MHGFPEVDHTLDTKILPLVVGCRLPSETSVSCNSLMGYTHEIDPWPIFQVGTTTYHYL